MTKQKVIKEIISWVWQLALVLVVVYLIRTFVFTMIKVEGESMLETLHDGDRIASTIIDLRFNAPERGQIVTLTYPNDLKKKLVIKRVVGLPGDTIEIRDGVTFLNGEAYAEPYVTHTLDRHYGPTTLGEDEYFVMGDNRANSHDSRWSDVGPVKREAITAVARLRLWPLDRIGLVSE